MKLNRSEWIIIAVLFLLGLLTRLAFRGEFLYHWDSVNFALSLENYDVRLHQPHPPGYFLYSALGTLINSLVHNPNTSLVLISIISGVFGILAVYWLGRLMFNREVGLAAAFITLTNPMHWFYSEVALSYALEFFLVSLIVGLAYLQLTGSKQVWIWLAILLGVAGGVRQNDLVFMLPLWFISLYPLTWKQRIGSVLILLVVCVAWFIPMAMLSGGLTEYLASLRSGTDGVVSESSIFSLSQLGLNVARMGIYLAYGLCLGALPLAWGAWKFIRSARQNLADKRVWVFALWILPAFAFYIFIHLRQPGHIFTFLPAIILLQAVSINALTRQFAQTDSQRRLRNAGLTALLVVSGAAFFLWLPASLFGSDRLPLKTPSRETLVERDQFLEERIRYIQEHFDPNTTMILAGSFNFRHPDYYLPEYFSYHSAEEATSIPSQVRTLVLFDDEILPELNMDAGFETVTFEGDSHLRYMTWDDDQQIVLPQTSLELQPEN